MHVCLRIHACAHVYVRVHTPASCLRHTRAHTHARAQAVSCLAIPVILYTGKKKKRYINISKRKTKDPNYLMRSEAEHKYIGRGCRPPAPRVCACMCIRVYARIRTCVCGYMYGYAGMQVYRQGCGRTHPLTTQRSSFFYFRSDRGEGSTLPPTPLTGLPLSPSLGHRCPDSLILVNHGEPGSSSWGLDHARGDPDQTHTHALCGGARGGEGGETWACARGVRGRVNTPGGYLYYISIWPPPPPPSDPLFQPHPGLPPLSQPYPIPPTHA